MTTQHSGTHAIDLHGLHDAIDEMAGAFWSDSWSPAVEHLTCREAEALSELLRCLDLADLADALMHAHSFGDDDPEDDHHEVYLANQKGASPCSPTP